jgi:hypothetical protein
MHQRPAISAAIRNPIVSALPVTEFSQVAVKERR